MFNLKHIGTTSPFSLPKKEKEKLFTDMLYRLTKHHYLNCSQYKKILDTLNFTFTETNNVKNIPPLPVRLFKNHELKSVDTSEIIKTMTSSGTSGQSVSKIYLDRFTATNQTKVLAKILADFIGKQRLPMLIIDTASILKNRNSFSARGAGILGFTMFGYDVTYALKDNMNIDFDNIKAFSEKHKGKNILVFGFTSIIWEHFHKPLLHNKNNINLEKAIMIHGGGWKKLQNESVDSKTFRSMIQNTSGINKIYNYYGMIEQTGSIFMECSSGYLHCSDYSDISILNNDFLECGKNEVGLVKLYSLLPYSYPGHILLTEDRGELIGEDDCKCGRLGKYFKIHGRILNAEIRGCSDTYKSK